MHRKSTAADSIKNSMSQSDKVLVTPFDPNNVKTNAVTYEKTFPKSVVTTHQFENLTSGNDFTR